MKTSASPRRSTEPASLLRDFHRIYSAALLVAGNLRAASLETKIRRGKPGSAHLTFGRDVPLKDRMAASFAGWLDVWEAEVAEAHPRQLPAQDKVSAARKAQTRAILAEVGMDPTAVAYMHGSTTENVEKLRGKYARDPKTGQRSSELKAERIDGAATHHAALTAPAETALARYEERHADGEVGR